jgi:ABC-type multidrug transport system permease subunit
VTLPFLALLFVSGVFFTFQDMPAALRYIGDVFPLRWLVDAVRAAYLGLDYVHTRDRRVSRVTSTNGITFHRSFVLRSGPVPVHGFGAVTSMAVAYAVLAGWAAAFAFVAVYRFRWEPRPN